MILKVNIYIYHTFKLSKIKNLQVHLPINLKENTTQKLNIFY